MGRSASGRAAGVFAARAAAPPALAPVPQGNGPDGRPLSKRPGSTSVGAFREHGILPEALVNYLALLGWSKDDHTTFLSRDELTAAFDLDRVSSNPAMFDSQKLEWMNNHYIQTLDDDDDLAARCLHFLSVAGLTPELGLLRRAMPLVRERMKTLAEGGEPLTFLSPDDVEPNEKARALLEKAGGEYLRKAADALAAVEPWTAGAIQATLDAVAGGAGRNRTKGWQPIRG